MQLSNNIIECNIEDIDTHNRLIEVTTRSIENTYSQNSNIFDYRILKAHKNFSFPWPRQAPLKNSSVNCSVNDVKCNILSKNSAQKQDYIKIKMTIEIIIQAKFIIKHLDKYNQYKHNFVFKFSKVLTLMIPDKSKVTYKILKSCCSPCEVYEKKVFSSFDVRILVKSKMPHEI